VPPGLGASGELLEEPGLADPRLPRQLDRARMASVELVQDPLERTKLVRTPDQVPGNQSQILLLRALSWRWELEPTSESSASP
jgi:hypothetical protein